MRRWISNLYWRFLWRLLRALDRKPAEPFVPAEYTSKVVEAFNRNRAMGDNVTREYPRSWGK
jgi:hypothetical protein